MSLLIDLTGDDEEEAVIWPLWCPAWWPPKNGQSADYTQFPADLLKGYFMPLYCPFRVARPERYKRPFNPGTLKLRLVCSSWRDAVDRNDAFWRIFTQVKTHETWFASAMALVTMEHSKWLTQEKQRLMRQVDSCDKKLVKKREAVIKAQREVDSLEYEKDNAEDELQYLQDDDGPALKAYKGDLKKQKKNQKKK